MSDQKQVVSFAELIERGILEIGDGYRAKNSELGGSGPIFLRAGHLTDSGWEWEGTERFHADLSTKVAPKMAKAGDTVITTKGNSTGRSGYVAIDAPKFVYSPHLSYWRTKNPDKLSSAYLRYWAISPEFTEQLHALAHGTDMAPYLSLTDQRRLSISLPRLHQQAAIGATLGALDDKIAVNNRIATTADSLCLTLASEKVWTDRTRLDSLCVLRKDQVAPSAIADSLVDHYSLPSFDSGKTAERVAPDTIKSIKFLVSTPVVLLSKLNPDIPRVWNVYPDSDIPALASTEFLVLEPREGVSTHELWAVAAQSGFLQQLVSKVTGTSKSHQRVRPAEVMTADVVDPRAFGPVRQKLEGIALRAASARAESLALAALRDALLPQLMSGRLRVRDAEQIVEDAL